MSRLNIRMDTAEGRFNELEDRSRKASGKERLREKLRGMGKKK